MMQLLKTDLRRYFTNPLLWIAVLIALLFGAELGFNTIRNSNTYFMLDDFYPLLLLFALAAVLALLISSQHKDGIFRSKIIAGHRKSTVFLAELFAAMLVSAMLPAAFFLPVLLLGGKTLSNLPQAQLRLGIAAIFLAFLAFAALYVLFGISSRSRLAAAACCAGAAVLLYALNYYCNDALHAPERYVINLVYTDNDRRECYSSSAGQTITLPKDSGICWNADGILVRKDGQPVNFDGAALEEGADPIRHDIPHPKYVGGPLRAVLIVCDSLNPVRPLPAACSVFHYSAEEQNTPDDTGDTDGIGSIGDIGMSAAQYRAAQYELLRKYLPWQLGGIAVFSLLGMLLFRRKELN